MIEDISVEGENNDHLFIVEYEVEPAEPDVGIFGNGDKSISVESVYLKFGNRLRPLNLPLHSWIHNYISDELYERMA